MVLNYNVTLNLNGDDVTRYFYGGVIVLTGVDAVGKSLYTSYLYARAEGGSFYTADNNLCMYVVLFSFFFIRLLL